MLEIFDNLKPFLEDNYRRFNVREYARIRGISAPTASVLLSRLNKEGLLNREEERNYIYYFANKENRLFISLLRTYWLLKFEENGLIEYLEKELITPLVILFGSFSKAEVKEGSDIDVALFTPSRNKLDLGKFEKKLGRKIQLFLFKDRKDVKNGHLLSNILNGFIISGSW